MRRETKKRLSARDLRGLGANPGRVRRVIPPEGGRPRSKRPEKRGTAKGGGRA